MGSSKIVKDPKPGMHCDKDAQCCGQKNQQKTVIERAPAIPGQNTWPPRLDWRLWDGLCHTTAVSPSLATPLKGLPCDPALLRERTVAVFGLGAVGGVVFSELAKIGVGTLIGVDQDTYGEDSWLTQPCTPSDAGRWKAWLQGELAHMVNPHTRVLTAVGCAQDVPLGVLRHADVLVVAGDNLELLVWAGVLAGNLGVPLIQGAVHGETGTCFVRAFDRTQPDGPCPACLVNEKEWGQLTARFGCDPQTLRLQGTEPTRTLPTVCRTTAEMVATEVLLWLAGKSDGVLRDTELALSLFGRRLWRTALPRNSDCRCPHNRWSLVELGGSPAEMTLGDLVIRLGPSAQNEASAHPQIRSEVPWITAAQCAKCGRSQPVRRFARLGESVGVCQCGAPLVADRMGMTGSMITKSDLPDCLGRPLAELGIKDGSLVGLSLDGEWTYFFGGGELDAIAGSDAVTNM